MPNYGALNDEFEEKLKKTARFVRAAFHIHSPESRDWPRAGSDGTVNDKAAFLDAGGERAYVDQLASRFSVVCITDHMKSAYACRLAQSAASRDDIAVFPGMEVNCRIGGGMSERMHLLVVFPPDKDVSAIDRIFAGAALPGEADRNGSEDFKLPSTLRDWVQAVQQEGGLVIAAHIDEIARGHRAHFRAMRDASVRMFVTDAADASITINDQRTISEEYKTNVLETGIHVLEVMKPGDRQHYVNTALPDGRQIRIPCVIRSDHHCIEDLDRSERTTYVKVSRLDFGCVRQALEFHETRIKFASDLLPSPSPRIVGLRMRSPSGAALFDEVSIAFNENLNCLIGPRGCGKSTVIEAIRFVLGQNVALYRDGREAGLDYRALALRIQQANLIDTIIELIYEVESGERHYLRATFDPKSNLATEAFSLDGDVLPLTQSTMESRYPVRMYSWSEIETLGREPHLQRSLVDRFIERLPEYMAERTDFYGALTRNRKAIEAKHQELLDKRREDGGLLGKYAEYLSDFDRINKPDVAALFEELDSARERLNTALSLATELDELRNLIEGIAQEHKPAQAFGLDRENEPFGVGVQVRAPRRQAN